MAICWTMVSPQTGAVSSLKLIFMSVYFIETLESKSGTSLSITSASMVTLWLALFGGICVFFVALKVFQSPKRYTLEVL